MHDPREMKVALLCGGSSTERGISLLSGEGASEALTEAGYSIEVLDPANKADLLKLMSEHYDVAFICLHGEGGEDGRIQGFLETIGIPYTCSGVVSSAICMDKALAKKLYRAATIPTPTSIEVSRSNGSDEEAIEIAADQIRREIGEECVIKIPSGGSSIGVYIAKGENQIEASLSSAFQERDTVLVEKYVKGREVTVVVLDRILEEIASSNIPPSGALSSNKDSLAKSDPSAILPEKNPTVGSFADGKSGEEKTETCALPIIEIIPANDSYDYDSKYLPGGSKHICPAKLSPETTATIRDLAVRAHKVLGCSGVSRTDFIIDEESCVWALETNTVPGMTGTSLLPDAARAAGISFPDLCVQLIENALKRKR